VQLRAPPWEHTSSGKSQVQLCWRYRYCMAAALEAPAAVQLRCSQTRSHTTTAAVQAAVQAGRAVLLTVSMMPYSTASKGLK
jgi:hypothetical protein